MTFYVVLIKKLKLQRLLLMMRVVQYSTLMLHQDIDLSLWSKGLQKFMIFNDLQN